jgi:hypothetical protein
VIAPAGSLSRPNIDPVLRMSDRPLARAAIPSDPPGQTNEFHRVIEPSAAGKSVSTQTVSSVPAARVRGAAASQRILDMQDKTGEVGVEICVTN